MKTLIFGPPGTGKTTRLLNIVRDALRDGVLPEEIAFCSFTKKAVSEAVMRAAKEFEVRATRFVYFKTLHSLCFNLLGLKQSDVIGATHFKLFGDTMGYKLTGNVSQESDRLDEGDKLLFLENYSRLTQTPLKEMWEKNNLDVTWHMLKDFEHNYSLFKAREGVLDFTDMLTRYIKQGAALPVKLFIVDEAQDLCTLQWDVVNLLSKGCPQIYIAGDDDQAIYKWAGAKTNAMLDIPVDKKEVLPHSYRLPKVVHRFAKKFIEERVLTRQAKEFYPREEVGKIEFHSSYKSLDLSGKWLILARTNYILKQQEVHLRQRGIVYSIKGKSSIDKDFMRAIKARHDLSKGCEIEGNEAKILCHMLHNKLKVQSDMLYTKADIAIGTNWYDDFKGLDKEDKDYYNNIITRGASLYEAPTIHLDTIHGSKGGEATKVLLITDISRRVYDGMDKFPEDEARIFYVGMTRAKEELHIMYAQTRLGYDI
jgi:DNA helicase-2/ATP-dependent DNA helicase PcrA